MNNYEIIKLKWIDAQMIADMIIFPDELPDKPIECEIVGFLVKETKDCYYLAHVLWKTGQIKWTHIIPKKYVVSKVVLK